MYKGIAQNDVGKLTDIIDNVPKPIGINMLIRSMSPQVIFCDEIGSKEDVQAIEKAVCSGVKGIFSAHAENLTEFSQNSYLKSLIDNKLIRRIIVLDKLKKGYVKEFMEV